MTDRLSDEQYFACFEETAAERQIRERASEHDNPSSLVENVPSRSLSSLPSTRAEGSTGVEAVLLGSSGTAGVEGTTGVGTLSSYDVRGFAERHGWPAGRRLSKSEFVTWRFRLDVESGRRRPYVVAAGQLPDSTHPVVQEVYQGFVYLLACRWLHTPNEPAPFTKEFAARWCGVTERQAKDARRELVRLRALVHVGYAGRAKLWMPGELAA